ncbi:MAG: universal stress protein [Rhodospirillaceae bacterium]|nr:universal stress protein [Rhodospirillaceae bacterium]MBT5191537.1 universal stress protein [Rhodospirillaceae bacterium]MBT5898105.1 universal stress protein [Rhodospirillaceae bacterium]MBT6429471.1 universal stress protein [Rhodospirillaceae bacterium]MBT7758769.1 universal stress protein [Rhodospirillaceae bacterium]
MSYKRILVPLDGTEDAVHALWLAFEIARRFDGRVIGLHAALDTAAAMPYMGESMSATLADNMISSLETAADARLQAAQRALDAAGKDFADVVGELKVVRGPEDTALARHGCLADLVVVARPASDTALSESHTMQAAIMDTGRPVLVAPPARSKTFARNILAAWNGSPQAARALTAALPLMREAEAVTLLQIEEGSVASVGDAVDYLAAHGCKAQGIIRPRTQAVGDTLLEAAFNEGADLIVMGAYTHNRIRELIFGGATLDALLDATIPLLMAH